MKRWGSIALPIAIGVVIGLGGTVAVEPRLPTAPFVRGLRVGGEQVAEGSDLRARIEARDAAFRDAPVLLKHGDTRIDTTYGALGASVDIDATVRAAEAVGHSGSLIKRLRETQAARRGDIDVPLVYRLDETLARGLLEKHAPALQRDPVDARLDLEAHRKVPDVPGQELDVAETIHQLREAYLRGDGELYLVTRTLPAEVTLTELEDIDVDRVLSTFETTFKVWERGRSANVALAASKLNGLIMRPHAVISFNDRVGPRTVENGFQQAPEIVGDELTVGIGGGTCQVSSTLHGAALHGGLAVVDRRSHSRPSSYTLLGLDATVAYPDVDLKLMNPYNFSVVIHAFIPEPGTLRVELLGGEAVQSVEYKYGVSRIEPFVRRITVKHWLQSGKGFRKQKGTRGMDVHSYVRIHYKDGRIEERQFFSGYRATPEVFWVAPDYDENELPPLPEHAKGVEGRLHEDGSDVYPTTG